MVINLTNEDYWRIILGLRCRAEILRKVVADNREALRSPPWKTEAGGLRDILLDDAERCEALAEEIAHDHPE